ncbi:MAG: prolyl oligopeptidase family serine peptidase [Planctomycetaceae bacterium]
MFRVRMLCLLLAGCLSHARITSADDVSASDVPELTTTQVVSSLDGMEQPVRYWAPDEANGDSPLPLFVFLHSWSGDYTQDNSKWLKQAVARNWIFLHPNFRGVNETPQACGSEFARRDVLDAIDFACEKFRVDRRRIYLAGTSGGGHMAMLMAAYHPDRFSAVSEWVGISDLQRWYHFHVKEGQPQRYAQMIVKCLGGPPGTSPEIDASYQERSPLFHLSNAADLPLDFNAGVHDGHTGSVPIDHTLNAYLTVTAAHGTATISSSEIAELLQEETLSRPTPSDEAGDPTYGRRILLRRQSRNARVTIFEGGHEGLPEPACEWLSQQSRLVQPESSDRQEEKAIE